VVDRRTNEFVIEWHPIYADASQRESGETSEDGASADGQVYFDVQSAAERAA